MTAQSRTAAHADRAAVVAQNTRATRIAFVVAGGCGELALQPLLPFVEWLALLALFLVIGAASAGQPFAPPKPPAGEAGHRTVWPVRQLVAVLVITLAGVESLTRLRPGDVAAEGRALALLMMFVQFAHALASRTRREMALGCAVMVPTLAVAAVFGGDVTLVLPMTLSIAGIAVTAALLHRDTLLESATAVSAGGATSAVRACVAPLAVAVAVGALLFLVLPDTPQLRAHTPLGRSGRLAGAAGDRGAAGVGAQTGSMLVALVCTVIVWVVFRVTVAKEERFLLERHGEAYAAYLKSTPRFLPNPGLWKPVDSVEVFPKRVVMTFLDGMLFVLPIPIIEGLEKLQEIGWIPVLLNLP